MDIKLDVNDAPVHAELALPAAGKGPGVLVLHAWWGLKPFFRDLCARLAAQGFVALAPDLNNGEIARTVAEAEAFMRGRDFQRSGEIVMAAEAYLRSHPACTSQKIGVIGFSMGAGWALVAATRASDEVGAVALFYGRDEVDFSKIRAKVLGHFSDVDEWEPFDDVQVMLRDMRAAGVDIIFYTYPGLSHWFVEDDRPEYNPQAAALAWERTVAFLHENVA